MRARAFFFVCAGLFLLALGYHFGATSATAQSGSIISGPAFSGFVTGVVGRTLYAMNNSPGSAAVTVPEPVPGTSPVVATGGGGPEVGFAFVMLGNGDAYRYYWGLPGWEYIGNLVGGATPASQKSWGQVKADHR